MVSCVWFVPKSNSARTCTATSRIAPLLRVLWISEGLHRRALERLVAIDRRDVSLVDCVSFVTMDAEGIEEVLALDQDFHAQGFRVLPS